MIDRDRLIELFKKIEYKPFPDAATKYNLSHQFTDYALESIIDCIIANGVVLPPCKVGDTVYMPWNYNNEKGIAILEVTHFIIDSLHSYIETDFDTYDEGFWNAYNGDNFGFSDVGKIVFLTYEEAEKALG